MRLADERGAEYDAHSDSFMEAPSIFLPQVESREWASPTARRAAIRVAVLVDVKIQRIITGLAKEDSYLDLITYLSVLTSLMFHDQAYETDLEPSDWADGHLEGVEWTCSESLSPKARELLKQAGIQVASEPVLGELRNDGTIYVDLGDGPAWVSQQDHAWRILNDTISPDL
jgi:hypothetical protein